MDAFVVEELQDLYEQMKSYYNNMGVYMAAAMDEWFQRSSAQQRAKEVDNVVGRGGLYPTKDMWAIIFAVLKERYEFSPLQGDDIEKKFNEIAIAHLDGRMTDPDLVDFVGEFKTESTKLRNAFKEKIRCSYLETIQKKVLHIA